MQVLKGLDAGSKCARAFFNTDKIPPMLDPGNSTTVRDIKFARYASVLSTVLKIAGLWHPQSRLDRIMEPTCLDGRLVVNGTLEQYAIGEFLAEYHNLRIKAGGRPRLITGINNALIHKINEVYTEVIARYFRDPDEIVKRFGNVKSAEFLTNPIIYGEIFDGLRRELAGIRVESKDELRYVIDAIEVVDRILYVKQHFHTSGLMDVEKSLRDRVIFTTNMCNEWERLCAIPRDEINLNDLRRAGKFLATYVPVGSRLLHIIELLKSYSDDYVIDFEGLKLKVVAGPFAMKGFFHTNSVLQMALYPLDESISTIINYVNDPRFSHADGAIAIAGMSIKEGTLILEEVQTDVPDLFRRAGYRVDDFLIRPLDRLVEMVLAAVREFCIRKSFRDIYASTPFRIFDRYKNEVDPSKVNDIYYRELGRISSGLVFDDLADIDHSKQHYWKIQ